MNAVTTANDAESFAEPRSIGAGYQPRACVARARRRSDNPCGDPPRPVEGLRVNGRIHQFEAVAFVENFNLREMAQAIPGGRLRAHELRYPLEGGGEVFVYPFGAAVFHDAPAEQRERFLERI